MTAVPCPPDGPGGDASASEGPSQTPPNAPPDAPQQDTPSLVETLSALWCATVARYQARLELIGIEVRRASLSLGHIVVLALLCAFLLWTAWFTAMACLVWLVGHFAGTYAWGFLLVIGLNLLAVAGLWRLVLRLTHHLTLPHVRAHVFGGRHE